MEEDAEPFVELPAVDPVSLSNSDAVLVVQSEQFFTPEGARAMRDVVTQLESLEHVERILWMDRVPILNIFGLPEPLLPKSEASPEKFSAAREKAMQHPLVGGQILSDDGQTILLLVTYDWDYVRSNEQCIEDLRLTAERTAEQHSDFGVEFQVTGHVPAIIAILEAHETNRVKYQAIGYGVVVLMAIILFRGVRAVLIVVLAPVTGLIWTLGIVRYWDLPDNPFIDIILPVMLLLVGLTDGVHLMVQIRKLRSQGMDEHESTRLALKQVGLACFLTSLTTAIGFGSLMLADHPWVQDFGFGCVIGVGLMFVAVVTVIPLLSATRLGRNIHAGQEGSLIDRNLSKIGVLIEVVLRRPGFFGWAGVWITIALIAISGTLRPDERRSNALPESSEVYKAMQHMDQAMGGLEFSRIDIHWEPAVESDDPEILEVVAEVDDLLNSEPLIGHPISIRNLVDALPGSGLPRDRMSMIELLPPRLKRAFFTPEHHNAVVNFRVQDLGIAKFGPVFERLERDLEVIPQPSSEVSSFHGGHGSQSMAQCLSDCRGSGYKFGNGGSDYLYCAGHYVSILANRPDIHRSKSVSSGRYRSVARYQRSVTRTCQRAGIHRVFGYSGG